MQNGTTIARYGMGIPVAPPERSYADPHRLFVQAMMSHKILGEDRVHAMYEQIQDMTHTASHAGTDVQGDANFATFLGDINAELNELDLSLRRSTDERSGESVIALVSIASGNMAHVATDYTADELTYYKAKVDAIMHAKEERYTIGSLVALDAKTRIRSNERALDRFVQDGWLYWSETGDYALGVRALMDLAPYLRDHYAVGECWACTQVLTTGERCQNQPQCGIRLHRHCASRHLRSKGRCPSCGQRWSRDQVFGFLSLQRENS